MYDFNKSKGATSLLQFLGFRFWFFFISEFYLVYKFNDNSDGNTHKKLTFLDTAKMSDLIVSRK